MRLSCFRVSSVSPSRTKYAPSIGLEPTKSFTFIEIPTTTALASIGRLSIFSMRRQADNANAVKNMQRTLKYVFVAAISMSIKSRLLSGAILECKVGMDQPRTYPDSISRGVAGELQIRRLCPGYRNTGYNYPP